MNDRLRRQADRCAMPHICKYSTVPEFPIFNIAPGLNMICTHPKYRRRGVAALMMQWGVERADERDCDMFIEAAVEGRLLYQNFGLLDVDKLSTPRPEGETDGEWKKLEEMYPFTATWMWRPKQGGRVKGSS
jgi:GNAT superfamily N-acetyltransferase